MMRSVSVSSLLIFFTTSNMMSTAVVFWTILGTVVGFGCVLVLVAYLVWRFYLHPKSKVADSSDSFYEEITETEIKTVTSHPQDGATVVTQNVRTRTRSSRPRARRESKDLDAVPQPKDGGCSPSLIEDSSTLLGTWNVPSLMNNWRESEEDFVKMMSKSNFRQLPWKVPYSRTTARHLPNKPLPSAADDKIEIIELF